MNRLDCFSSFLSSYQDLACNALYDSISGDYWNDEATITAFKIASISTRLILSIPLYLANGAASLLGKAINWIAKNPEELSRILNPQFPYSPLAQKTLDFARQQITEHPQNFSAITSPNSSNAWYSSPYYYKPANQEIILLTALYDNIFKPALLNSLKQNPNNPWNRLAVIEAADSCMKIGYAISALTLDDLAPFNKKLAASGFFSRVKTRTNVEALVRQDSYQYKTFYTCTDIYHLIRGGLYYHEEGSFHFPNRTQILSPHPTNPNCVKRGEASSPDTEVFYKEQTIQNSWNVLYNDYCDRIRLYADERSLYRLDERHVEWTQKDTEPKEFCYRPCTQPT